MSKKKYDEIGEKECHCCDDCDCGDECDCDKDHKCSDKCTCDDKCKCHDECDCDDECDCHKDKHHKHHKCKHHVDDDEDDDDDEDEDDDDECHCHDHKCHCKHDEEDDCHCHGSKEEEYLNLAKQIQADFDNFRRRTLDDIKYSELKGKIAVLDCFLPCLDTFKEAKKMINDESVLEGIEMIEDKINDALKSLGVEKISSIGEKYNPHFHNVIAVLRDEDKENDIILDEYQAGYILNDKVIRYAKVIVNKKED